MARWERQNRPTNLIKAAPENPSSLPGIAFFIFAIFHILAFPILGSLIEQWLYGTSSSGRQLRRTDERSSTDVIISSFSKTYVPSWWARRVSTRFGKRKETVVAVDDLNLEVPQGQIVVLLGGRYPCDEIWSALTLSIANGSGKSTTLDCIAGLRTVTSGNIVVDGHGGIGICPQANIMWDSLTALEHVWIFNRLKSVDTPASKSEVKNLLNDCDLSRKHGSRSKALSGGQKRKLQLAMMLAGGARVCCVDEASSGVDPLARRSLWNILLRERGRRTIILTTHFLDEADLLSDQIAILSKGQLKAFGSSVELKHRLGGGFRIHVFKDHSGRKPLPIFEGIIGKELVDQVVYNLPDSSKAATFVSELDSQGWNNYEISSPTVEEIFFTVAESAETESSGHDAVIPTPGPGEAIKQVLSNADKTSSHNAGLELQTGKPISVLRQAIALFRKRWTVFQRNYLPYAAAFLIPVIAAGLVTLFLKNFTTPTCSPTEQITLDGIDSLLTQSKYDLVIGPSDRATLGAFEQIQTTLPGGGNSSSSGLADFISNVHVVESLDSFNTYIQQNYANVTPGGFFLGNAESLATFAYKGDDDISLAVITQNTMNTLLTNISIGTQYQAFDTPWIPSTGKTLQLIVYFGLAMAAYPAFFGLYPTLERLRNVRQLHYSNGVKSVSLWSAYLLFDFANVLASSVLATIIFRAVNDSWYHLEYLFVVLLCYGLASTLFAYVLSLFSRSQLAAFAFVAGGQAVMFLLYFVAYLSVFTYSPTNRVDDDLLTMHFIFSIFTPTGSLIRSLFVSLNIFSTTCLGRSTIASYPGDIKLYGGPILYLIVQSLFLFGVLLWWDSGSILARFRRKQHKSEDDEKTSPIEPEIAAEIKRVNSASGDGLRVEHISKAFGKTVAVQDVTFGVRRGEVFALLGPNGAGKSTTISLVRGDIQPSPNDTSGTGEIYVENIPVSKRRAAARNKIGVCPQFDCCDQMDVLEHLTFYARIRGVDDVPYNVKQVIKATGLESFQHRMAAKLSGGNKRKLSLAIALMGNPSVLLLDEPSSGMDVCAKRVMWRTLASVTPGRSLVLTTHSMEEADALADRAGIIGRKMLALGTSQELRRKHGDRYYVHLIMKTAPHSSDDEMEMVKEWVGRRFGDAAEVEERTFHGQLRFSVPALEGHLATEPVLVSEKEDQPSPPSSSDDNTSIDVIRQTVSPVSNVDAARREGGIGALFTLLEAHKQDLGFEYYSVSPTTLDQVFLSIVGKHNIEEENYGRQPVGGRRGEVQRVLSLVCCLGLM